MIFIPSKDTYPRFLSLKRERLGEGSYRTPQASILFLWYVSTLSGLRPPLPVQGEESHQIVKVVRVQTERRRHQILFSWYVSTLSGLRPPLPVQGEESQKIVKW
jgi:hypothetical protein